MKSKIYCIPEPNNAVSVTGKGQKGLVIVVKKEDLEAGKETLNGLIKAIKLNRDEDVLLVEIDKPIKLIEELKDRNYTNLILLGVTPAEIGFIMNAKLYFWYKMENNDILVSDSITSLNQDKDKKITLWKCLQSKFLN